MNYIVLRSRAKINVTLDIIEKLSNGYHNMSMIMQTLELHDTITITKNQENLIEVRTNLEYLPTDCNNLAYQAAEYMFRHYDIKCGVDIYLDKKIPVAAGLAGGSGNCAATLIGINKLFNLEIAENKLMEIGSKFGADVPYCIMEGTALAEGIGDKLTRLSPHPEVLVLLVKPNFDVSTAVIFKGFDFEKVEERPNNELVIDCINKNNVMGIANNLCNVMETVSIPLYPIIQEIKCTMMDCGAIGSLMSGSGPTVFGYFLTEEALMNTVSIIKEKFKDIKEIHVTKIFNKLV